MRKMTVMCMVALAGLSTSAVGQDAVGGPSAAVQGAVITVATSHPAVPVGGVVEVQVFLTNAQNVAAYELHMSVTGGPAGSLELESIFVDKNRKRFLFGRAQVVEAIDLKGKRAAIITYSRGADVGTAAKAYLATFRYRVSPEANGVFTVNINTTKSFVSDSAVQRIAFRAGLSARVAVGKITRKTPSRDALGR